MAINKATRKRLAEFNFYLYKTYINSYNLPLVTIYIKQAAYILSIYLVYNYLLLNIQYRSYIAYIDYFIIKKNIYIFNKKNSIIRKGKTL